MTSFSLVVRFEGDESTASSREAEAEWNDALSMPVDSFSLDQVHVVNADSIAMYMSQGRSEIEKPTKVAIFVPHSLLDSLLESYSTMHMHSIASEPSSTSTSTCCSIQQLCEASIQTKTLAQIHPILEHEQCRIRGILRSKSKGPSDVLLLDISHCNGGWLDEIMRKLCGEPMSCCEFAVIEFFPISTIQSQPPDNIASFQGPFYEIPTCVVCLHRIYPPRLGMPKLRNDQLCSEYCIPGDCRTEVYLRPWPSEACKACQTIQCNEIENGCCNCCALQETLWICLTCGFVGCGRYSQGHAANHFTESQHAFSLEMATLRIWDYVSGEFAHRGDLLECPSAIRRHHPPQWANVALPWENDKRSTSLEAAASPKKATMIGEEYEVLLQSALEDQAQHYEGEISRLHAAFTAEQIDKSAMTESETAEIDKLTSEIKHLREETGVLGRNLLDMQAQEAGHRAASQRLLREQGIAKDLLDKIREEAEKEHENGKLKVEDLEQQVADLTANLRMRHQISQDEELNQAHIYGTVTTNTKQPILKRGGKKSRRSNRK